MLVNGDSRIEPTEAMFVRLANPLNATIPAGGRAKGVPYNPQSVLTMLYHVLGIDPATTLNDHNGRPVYLLDQREKIAELL